MVDLREFVTARVKHAYRVEDIECTPTTLRILSEIFNIDIDHAKMELIDGLGFKEEDIKLVSAKEGTGIKDLFEKIIRQASAV